MLGYLDDLVLIPLGVWLVRRLIPAAVLTDSRASVEADAAAGSGSRVGLIGAGVIILLWVVAAGAMLWGVAAVLSGRPRQ